LDEVPSIDRQKALIDLALNAQQSDHTILIVLTGRDHVVGSHLRRFPRVQVRSFDDAQVRELAAKHFHDAKDSFDSFFQQLAKVPTLLPLMGVPLLATIVFGLYKKTQGLPESRIRLYEMFINLMSGGWDVAKNVNRQTKFGAEPKLTVLKKLAGMLHVGLRRDCTIKDFQVSVQRTLPGLQDYWQDLLDETVQDGLLIPTGPTFAFAHLSYQEYLAAKDLFEPGDSKATHAVVSFLSGEEWWREVVLFYIALSDKPKDIERFIRKTANKVLTRTGDESVKSRAHVLFEWLKMSFPGSEPDFSL
jgi:predicted NACHT family NTPase